MPHIFPVLLLSALAMFITRSARAQGPVTIESLLDEMVRYDAVARWPSPEYTCRQASSYDRSEIAPDQPGWFGNNDNSQFIRTEEHDGHRESVMLDADGPGAIVRFWLTTDAHRDGMLRFYFDGAPAAQLEIPGYDLLAGGLPIERPLLAPHANYAPGKPGGNTLYLPLPYAKHCKVTWEERTPGNMPPRYYQIDYRTYAVRTAVETFSRAQLDAAHDAIGRANATLLVPPVFGDGNEARLEKRIEPGSEGTIDLPAGSAAVRLLTVKVTGEGSLDATLRGAVLRATFDGEETTWCPLSDFFGCGVGANEVRNWYRTVAPDGTMTCRWVMPYEKSARLTVSNYGTKPVQITLAARTGDWRWDARSMHFHTNWRQECDLPVKPSRDWRYLGATGRGVLVGDTLAVFNNTRAWYGEGDEKIRVDGESLPSHLGTGLEDYYNASWAPVVLYHTPWASAVRADHVSSVGHNTFTRTRNLDGIPFTRSLDFDMEIIHWRDEARVNFAAATYWYAFPGAKAAAPPSPEEAARPIPVADLPMRIAGAIECESLKVTAHSDGLEPGPQEMTPFGNGWSDERQLLAPARKPGAFIELRLPADAPKRLTLYATKAVDYGMTRISVNGKIAREFDGFAEKVLPTGPLDLGVCEPRDGAFVLRAEVIGANPRATGIKYLIGLDCIVPSDLAAPVHAENAGHELFRPQFHFTPEKNWMNDPNGMVFYGGEWHLFYQYNPFGDKWGHMSWGHAVSRDLLHWEHLPLALAEEDGIMIFSGSAVVDWKNTSGFGKGGQPPLIAIYTGHREGRQDERLAYSNDRGRTWTKFPGNPVLDVKMADFRDPKVFWHEASTRWIMTLALATEKKVHFYASPDLKQWKYVGEFGGAGATNGLWECPDLFPLAVEGGGTKWVLIVNVNPGGPAGGSGCQYFVGEFDGTRFTPDPGSNETLWADYGADFYAGVSWSDVPKADGRRVWLGWMSNWRYGQDVPTSPWRSAMTVPRTLALHRTPNGLRLTQQPVAELLKLRESTPRRFAGGTFAEATAWLTRQTNLSALLDVEMSFTGLDEKSAFDLQFHTGPDEFTTIACDAAKGRLSIDRTHSGLTGFHPDFAGRQEAPLSIVDGRCTIRLMLDTSSLEVFAQDGATVLTDLIFPSPGGRALSLHTDGTGPAVGGITIHTLKSAR